jgi:hypothetical protein
MLGLSNRTVSLWHNVAMKSPPTSPLHFRAAALALATALLFAACVPTTTPVTPPTPPPLTGISGGNTSFYPNSAGLSWRYKREDASADAPGFELKALGNSIFDEKLLSEFSFVGLTQNLRYYREFASDGVKLHAIVYPGVFTYRYDPPRLEYPAPEKMVVGGLWSGESNLKISQPGRDDQFVQVTYRYRVLDKQQFKITIEDKETSYDTFLISLVERAGTEEVAKTIRFTPNIGEVRSGDGLLLADRSFR